MTVMRHVSAAGLLLLALGAAMPAQAQDRKAEISVGYQMLTLKDEEFDETLGRGWYADVAGNIGSMFAVVFQIGGNYKTFDETATIGGVTATATATVKLHEFLGGIRVGPRHTAVAPFAEFLIGGVNGSADLTTSVTGLGQTFVDDSFSESGTDMGMQIGGGVTIWLSKRIGVRGAVGYLRVLADGEDGDVIRAAGGITFGF